MGNYFDPKKYDYNAARAAAMLACHALAEDKDYGFAAHQLEKADQALSRVARRSYEIAPGADTSALLDATSRLYELCDDVHEQRVVSEADDAKIVAALDKVIEEHAKIAPGAPTSIDADASKSAGAGSGKAPTETGPVGEKTANAAPDKEIQTPKRKFSFGSMFGGKKFGSTAGPTGTGPKM